MQLVATINQSYLKIRFDEIFGVNLYDEDLRTVIGDEFISIIQKRTTKGLGVENGRIVKFKPYSKKYAEKTGKDRNKVDLDLYGDLLNSIEILKSTPQVIEIGIVGDQAPKAHGHLTGQYGKGPLPRRSFLGLTKQDLTDIRNKYSRDVEKFPKLTAKNFQGESKLNLSASDVLEAIAALKSGKVGF